MLSLIKNLKQWLYYRHGPAVVLNKNFNSYVKGISAELYACSFLTSNGYEILERRIRNKHGEIDILARKNSDVVAVEVKQRKSLGLSKECLTTKQMRRIAMAFLSIISQRNATFENYRIDVVCFDVHGRLEHIKNAFYIEDTV